MNICPICVASLSHHTLYGKFGSSVYMYHLFPYGKKKVCHGTNFEADLWPETRYIFFGGLMLFVIFISGQEQENIDKVWLGSPTLNIRWYFDLNNQSWPLRLQLLLSSNQD